MLVFYASKQLTHFRSIRVLVGAGQHRDAVLIARASLEGIAQLVWALRDPETRPMRWRSYIFIMEHKQMLRDERDGIEAPTDRKAAIAEGLKKFGRQFIKQKFASYPKKGRAMPDDPYVWEWMDLSEKELFAEIEATTLYETVYSGASNWAHWNIYEMASGMRRKKGVVVFPMESPAWAAAALASGFLGLFQTLEQVALHFEGDNFAHLLSDLTALRTEYDTRFSDVSHRIQQMIAAEEAGDAPNGPLTSCVRANDPDTYAAKSRQDGGKMPRDGEF
jgi:hypothetical protein